MATEIRRVKPDELVDYLRVLPYANGLPQQAPPAAWHGGPEAWPQPRPPAGPEQLSAWAGELRQAGHVHPQAAFVDGRLVGGSAMISFEITVPGGRTVPMGGVTSTAVTATHRRRGLLRQMMRAMFDEARERGEPLAGLSASEGSIYGRFGYGPATRRTCWELLLDFDLTRRVVAAPRPADEPLRWMLDNPRAMRVTRQSDSLWIRLLDVPAALAARGYDVGGTITLGIESDLLCPGNEGCWRLDAGPGDVRCTRVTAPPDLVIDIEALGSLYLGGMSAALLASAGRIRGGRGAVGLLARMFRTDPEPFNTFVF